MRSLLQNLRYAFRTLRDNLGLTLTILITIALGIGANTAIFTAAYATLLAPLPYPQADQLVNVWSKVQGHRNGVSPADFTDWKGQSKSFQDLNAASEDNFNVATPERPEFLDGVDATPGFSKMLGNPLFLGRNFLPEEGEPGKQRVVILTHRLWQRLGANRKIIGQALRMNGEPYTVVGVFAPGVFDRLRWELMVPLVFKPEQLNDRDSRYWLLTGRLRPGVNIRQAQAEMDVITAKLARDYPKSNQGWGALVEPYKNDFLESETKSTLWLLLGAVGFLLLIACMNVANLLLAKGITRQREVAIRGALGARPRVIFAQFLTESLLFAILAGVAGIATGYAMLRALVAVMPPDTLPAEADLRLNIPILLVMLAAATLAGVVFGCAPAWYASRVDPAGALKDGGRAGMGAGRQQLRRMLMVGEFAVSLALLAGAGLSIHSFWNLTHVDLGVRTDHILGFYIDSVPLEKAVTQDKTNVYYRRVLDSILTVPGVSRACAVSYLPLDNFHVDQPFSIAGQAEFANPSLRPNADLAMVTPDYFETFGIRIVRGRGFTDADNASSVKVAMVNETFVARFLKGLDPLRQRVLMEQVIAGEPQSHPIVRWQIVGVFHTVKSRGSREDNPEIDTPFWQEAFDISGVAVRTTEDPAAMIKRIAAAVNAVDPQAALWRPRTMEQVHDEVLANDRFTLVLFASFAAVALLLATVGIYGVMAFSVSQRSREIALRMAIGATRSRVMALVMKEALLLAGVGLGLGLFGAYFVGRAMQSILFGVAAIDFSVFCAVGLLLLLVSLAATCWPAFRAASIETMQVLRNE
ncbi:MAG TPA: ABC transporter permease [Bryobacteraceae bacterium]|jgi:putative ABC transport system permease protein|nr:ABC transporter permease [Bryobacteraceae bacterium]